MSAPSVIGNPSSVSNDGDVMDTTTTTAGGSIAPLTSMSPQESAKAAAVCSAGKKTLSHEDNVESMEQQHQWHEDDDPNAAAKKRKIGGCSSGIGSLTDAEIITREKRRLERNRIKSRNARRRKKQMVEMLEDKMKEVCDLNSVLKDENTALKRRIAEVEEKLRLGKKKKVEEEENTNNNKKNTANDFKEEYDDSDGATVQSKESPKPKQEQVVQSTKSPGLAAQETVVGTPLEASQRQLTATPKELNRGVMGNDGMTPTSTAGAAAQQGFCYVRVPAQSMQQQQQQQQQQQPYGFVHLPSVPFSAASPNSAIVAANSSAQGPGATSVSVPSGSATAGEGVSVGGGYIPAMINPATGRVIIDPTAVQAQRHSQPFQTADRAAAAMPLVGYHQQSSPAAAPPALRFVTTHAHSSQMIQAMPAAMFVNPGDRQVAAGGAATLPTPPIHLLLGQQSEQQQQAAQQQHLLQQQTTSVATSTTTGVSANTGEHASMLLGSQFLRDQSNKLSQVSRGSSTGS